MHTSPNETVRVPHEKSVVRTGEIKALSGLRIVAAVWVVLFHFRPLLEQAAPGFRTALAPVLDCGAQGVDLFFILSGFVLTWNYLDRMGESFSWRATMHFLWLRLSRVWPVYLVTMHLAVLWIIFTLNVGHVPSEAAQTLTAMNYIKQFLLVQLWFSPYFDGTSWDGPAWSISAEWLAYLLFGALVLVIFRVARATRARGLIYLALAALLPNLVLLMATGLFYTPWSWLPRIIMQFTAGALVCAAVRRLEPSDRARKVAGVAALLIGAAVIGILYLLAAYPIPTIYDSAGLVDVLFVPLVLTLAIGVGTLPALLSLRPIVYFGYLSFSLYMVHELVHTTWNWMVMQFGFQLGSDMAGKAVLVGLIASAFAGAALLYHFVEEPARKWMRGMMSPPRESKADTGHGRLQTIDGQRGERTPVVSARAG
jgi:peptidoglycan/LPS O-acetylase OafA/YrhL